MMSALWLSKAENRLGMGRARRYSGWPTVFGKEEITMSAIVSREIRLKNRPASLPSGAVTMTAGRTPSPSKRVFGLLACPLQHGVGLQNGGFRAR